MKKFLVYCYIGISLLASLGIHSAVSAADESLDGFINSFFGDLMSDMGTPNAAFGFKQTDIFSFKNKTDTTIEVDIPELSYSGSKIYKYSVRITNISMENYDNFDNYDPSSVIDETIEITDANFSGGRATLPLKNLKNDVSYFLTITPVSAAGDPGTASKELSFSLGNGTVETTSGSTDTNTDTMHGAAPNMNLASVTYDQDGLKVTVRWNGLAGADDVQISYTTVGDPTMNIAGKAAMSDQSFSFTVEEEGTYIVKLQPLAADGAQVGTETHQTVHLTAGTTTPGTTPTTTTTTTTSIVNVNVGPEDYIPHVMMLTFIGYIFYRRFAKR